MMYRLKFCLGLGLGLTAAFAAEAESGWVTVAKYSGAIQCESAGIALKTMKKELAQANIPARQARCGTDGLIYPAVCGAETGRLNLYDIPAKDLSDAAELGFQALDDLPDAQEAPCEREVSFEGKAAEIHIGGIGPGVDEEAFRKVRKTIGKAIADNVISLFVVYGYGIEGGFSSCVEESDLAPPNAFRDFIRKLRAVDADTNTTAYSVTAVESCAADLPE
ncbi:hypothetical protein JJL52_09700 [Methylomicrobium sp. RS1]|jgi:hypothetical protein|nr:hypothetical protein [Methylomicrobium sp. RS1]